MSYQVKFTRTVAEKVKFLHPDIKKSLKSCLTDISRKPYCGKELQEDLRGFWTSKFKRYRIIYKVDDQEKIITIYMVGHRRDVYELFSEYVKAKK